MFSSEITPWEKRIPGNMAVINEAIKSEIEESPIPTP
jgi:hypothetical protein